MGYNRDNFRRIKEEYQTKYIAAREEADRRRAEVEARLPEVEAIDRSLREGGVTLLKTAVGGGPEVEAKMAALRAENERLQAERREKLLAAGYPADYTEPHYACAKCSDTGYVDTRMCDCMRRALILAGYESSGLGALIETQTFDNFSLDYYRTKPEFHATMARNLAVMREFADTFKAGNHRNLLLMGGTGLGKTHLSSAVARVVIERGYDVCYVTAIGLLADYEYDRFKAKDEGMAATLDRYVDCDLLIVDDLGTEFGNQFTVSALYNLINVRLNRGLSTILSTNLTQKELRERYWDRITSRLLGEYQPLLFVGEDVRNQKLRAPRPAK